MHIKTKERILKIISFLGAPMAGIGVVVAAYDNPRLATGLILIILGIVGNMSGLLVKISEIIFDE